MLRKRPPATFPLLPNNNPDAGLEVLAWHAESVDAANLDIRKAADDIAAGEQGVASTTATYPSRPVLCAFRVHNTVTSSEYHKQPLSRRISRAP